jgi:hypothetical protein
VGSYGELAQLFQTVKELGLVLSELPHQRGPLVFEEISARDNEDGSRRRSSSSVRGAASDCMSPSRCCWYVGQCRCVA